MRNDRGFSLLEVLVALTVLGFLVVGLNSAARFGLVAWHTEGRDLRVRGDLDPVERTLRGLVEAMDPGTEIDPPLIQATAHALSFTTDMPVAGGIGPARRADVALLVDASRHLILRWSAHVHVDRHGVAAPVQETVLLDGVRRIDLAYWASEGTGWADSWSRPGLPSLVRIHLAMAEHDPRHWPDIVVAPMRVQPER